MNDQLIAFLKALKQYGVKNSIPNVTETGGQFLNMLISVSKSKNILEIGCANGYSTLWMAEAVKKNKGKITAVDFSEPTFKEAQENIKKMGFEKLVDFHLGNALKIVPNLKGPFDFVFIDGQKRSYLDFWKLIQPQINEKTIVVFDDILAFPNKTKPLMDAMKSTKDYNQLILPIDKEDGILIVTKK